MLTRQDSTPSANSLHVKQLIKQLYMHDMQWFHTIVGSIVCKAHNCDILWYLLYIIDVYIYNIYNYDLCAVDSDQCLQMLARVHVGIPQAAGCACRPESLGEWGVGTCANIELAVNMDLAHFGLFAFRCIFMHFLCASTISSTLTALTACTAASTCSNSERLCFWRTQTIRILQDQIRPKIESSNRNVKHCEAKILACDLRSLHQNTSSKSHLAQFPSTTCCTFQPFCSSD